jgi:hypothetical protein
MFRGTPADDLFMLQGMVRLLTMIDTIVDQRRPGCRRPIPEAT